MEIKTVLTIRWIEDEEKQFCEVIGFVDTYQERKQAILNVLPILSLSNQYQNLSVDEGTDRYRTLTISEGSQHQTVAEAEFTTVLKAGNSYFELTPKWIYPTIGG